MLDEEVARLRWQCRRGIKEVEILIGPFFEQHFTALSDAQQASFKLLLEANDAELFAWFMGHERPESEDVHQMVLMIQRAVSPNL